PRKPTSAAMACVYTSCPAASITAKSSRTGLQSRSPSRDTFDRDVPLSETEPMIRRLAERVWSASRKESRIARTVILKLKTSEFNVLTRSHTPGSPPSSCEELTTIALTLRERVELSAEQRFRLVGIGLSNFREPEGTQTQPALFE